MCLANEAIFLCNHDIRAHTTGCKRGLRWDVREALNIYTNIYVSSVAELRQPNSENTVISVHRECILLPGDNTSGIYDKYNDKKSFRKNPGCKIG